MLTAAASARCGSFSTARARGVAARRSGHTSSRSRTNGSVTSIGLAMRPSANAASPATYQRAEADSAHCPCAASVRRKKKVLRTSFRSEIQATDSTWSGCTANSAATTRLGHSAAVQRRSRANSISVFAR